MTLRNLFSLTLLMFILSISLLKAQQQTQRIEGRVIDKETKQPIAGTIIFVDDTYPVISTMSDVDGYFFLNDIPIGRQTLKAQKSNYVTFFTDNLMVRSAKEIYIEIELRKSAGSNEATVTTDNRENIPLNEFSAVSTRSFTVEETQRYAGSIMEANRMAQCFPGIQSYQDNESDIIIRGNSQTGVLYRLEGIDLRGIGHFTRPLSRNGAISTMSISVLDDSDISTGAFAAEYGNATAGVIDMHFRKGNLNSREYTARLGLFGIDFATEGPIKRGNSSYLVNYRYSTLGILSGLGFFVVRPNVANTYQDLSFHLSFESDDHRNQVSVFGMGGIASEQWYIKQDTSDWLTRLDFNRINNRTANGNAGISFTRLLDEKSWLKVVAGATTNQLRYDRRNAILDTTLTEINNINIQDYSLSATYSRKFSDLFRLKAGATGHGYVYDLLYSLRNYQSDNLDTLINTNGLDNTFWLQGYIQTSFRFGRKLVVNAGGHALYYTLNNTYSLEPRFSIQYQLLPRTRLAAAYGLHGQILPLGTYFIQQEDNQGNMQLVNQNLEMAKSHHAVFSVRQLLGQDLTLQIEAWYQQLYNQPIAADSSSNFYLFQQRDSYGFGELSSAGTGRNYGIDLMVEKYFRKGFFIIASGSIFKSTYTNYAGEELSTRFDNNFVSSLTLGYELNFKKGDNFSIGLRGLANGGNRSYPLNDSLSQIALTEVYQANGSYSIGQQEENPPFYYRADIRIAYRKDWPNFSFQVNFDAQNITNNTNNFFQYLYDVRNQAPFRRYESGILPVITFQLDF